MRPYHLFIAAVFIAGAIVRAPYIVEYRDVVNLDEATVGVMAFDILKGDPPLFFYGQKYFGPFEGLFLAAAFLVFPITPLTLRMTIAVISLLAVFVFWRGALKLMGGNGAAATLALLAVPPAILSIWSSLASGGHMGGLLLGALIFYATALIISSGERRLPVFFLYGVLIGFSIWMHPGLLLYVAAAGLAALAADWRLVIGRSMIAVVPGVVIGGAPFWAATLAAKLKTFDFGQERAAARPLSAVMGDLRVSIENIPGLLGFKLFDDPFSALALYAFAALALASLLYTLRNIKGSPAPVFGWALIILTVVFYAIVDANKWGWVQYRYYIPLIAGLALALGGLFQELHARKPKSAAALLGFLIALNLGVNYKAAFEGGESYYRMDTRLEDRFFTYTKLLPVLERLGISHSYTRLYDDACLIFQSVEKIIATAYSDSRLRKYSLAVDAAEAPAFSYLKSEDENFERNLKTKTPRYSIHGEGIYNVYHSISPPATAYIPVDMAGAEASANPNNGDIEKALDGDYDTFWNTARGQRGDEYIRLDFKTPVKIGRIDMIPTWITDTPKHIVVETSSNGRDWVKVAETAGEGTMYWAGPHLVNSVWEGFNQYLFKPTLARHVRIRQLGQAPSSHWHVREIFVYAPSENKIGGGGRPDWAEVVNFLNNKGIRRIIGDFYFSANVIRESGGRIWANVRRNEINEDERARWILGAEELESVAVHKRDLAQVERFFKDQGWRYKKKSFGDYIVFHDLRNPEILYTNFEENVCNKLNENTITCDFEVPRVVAAIKVFSQEISPGAEVYSSEDGLTWRRVGKTARFYRKIRWTGSHIIGMSASGTLVFPAIEARFVRIGRG